MRYDDGLIACDEDGIVIRRYHPWGGAKRIPYASIRHVTRFEMSNWTGKWRIWGSGDLRHWFNLDGHRSEKSVAFVLDTGNHWLPTITPDQPDEVAGILAEHAGGA